MERGGFALRRIFAGFVVTGLLLMVSMSAANVVVMAGKHGNSERSLAIADAEWTFMGYIAGDNNLEFDAVSDLAEMETVASVNGVNMLILMDTYSLIVGTHWYYLEPGVSHIEVAEDGTYISHCDCEAIAGGCPDEDVNMGSGEVLTQFLETAMTYAPAQKYMLDLWDHGGGWYGLCTDDTNLDRLTIDETAAAIGAANIVVDDELVPVHLDIIAYDACFMSTIETAYENRFIADYMVASITTVPGWGWGYDIFLEKMQALEPMDTVSVCEAAVDAFVETYDLCLGAGIGGWPYPSCSMINLMAIDELVEGVEGSPGGVTQLAEKLHELVNIDSYRGAIESAEARTPQIQFEGEIFPFADLGWLVSLLGEKIPDMLPIARGTLELLGVAVPYWDSVTTDTDACINTFGLSIYFTCSYEKFRDAYGDESTGLDMCAETEWDEFLEDFVKVYQ
jgi:hypothetical protein